jgi:hypothetical protein
MLEKKPDGRPANAREVVERLSLFRAAAPRASNAGSRASGRADGSAARVSGSPSRDTHPPPTPRMAQAPVVARPSGDTMHSGGAARAPAGTSGKSPDAGGSPERPRTDTIALVEQNAKRPREVPTWLAIVAIVALSLFAGMTTYVVRLKTWSPEIAPQSTTSATLERDRVRDGNRGLGPGGRSGRSSPDSP